MQRGKVLSISAVVIGVLLIIGAFLTAYWVTPTYVARLPDDVNADRPLAGTFKSLLDPQAVAQGNLAGALKVNIPLTVDRRVKVLSTSGNTALVSDARTTAAAGTPVEKTTWQYAVDRKTLEAVSEHPSSWSVVNATGLTVSFPFGSEKKTYTGWVPETATTTPVSYARSESRNGLNTYVYQANVSAAKITDSQILAGLPQALPQSLLRLLATLGPLTPAAKAQLLALLPTLSDPAPISYTLQGSDTFWVEPETGVVIDIERSQQRIAGVTAPNGTFVPLLPVVDTNYRQTAAGVSSAVHDANKGRNAILLVGTILPIIAGIVGALLIAAAFLVPRLRRKPAASTAPGGSTGAGDPGGSGAPGGSGSPGESGGPGGPSSPGGPGDSGGPGEAGPTASQ